MYEDSEANALGDYLRARRGRIRPSDVGLPAGHGQRRTPGLRREELAALAGVSVDYYTRLERGREMRPSDSVLTSIGRALRLGADERSHLFMLADIAAGRSARSFRTENKTLGPGTLHLLENVRPNPAHILSRTSDIIAANPEGLALMPGLADWAEDRRNTVRYVFTHPSARDLLVPWDVWARNCVAHLRAVSVEDPDLQALVAELSQDSEEFAELWQHYDVRVKTGGPKTFQHPSVGEVVLTSEVLTLADGEHRLVVYQAEPNTRHHDAVRLLAMSANA